MDTAVATAPTHYAIAEDFGPLGVEVTIWEDPADPDEHCRTRGTVTVPAGLDPEARLRSMVTAVSMAGFTCRAPWMETHNGWACAKVVYSWRR